MIFYVKDFREYGAEPSTFPNPEAHALLRDDRAEYLRRVEVGVGRNIQAHSIPLARIRRSGECPPRGRRGGITDTNSGRGAHFADMPPGGRDQERGRWWIFDSWVGGQTHTIHSPTDGGVRRREQSASLRREGRESEARRRRRRAG